jgi:hypothetical protein
MRDHMVSVGAALAVVMFLAGSAVGQESSATIRTYQGVSYKVADPSLEVFYTIGEPKEKPTEMGTQFGSMINISTSATSSTGAEPSAPTGKEERLLRGHSRASEFTVSRQGVETRIAWDQVRAIRFARKSVDRATLPIYVPHYRYSASVTTVTGQQVEADYINLGATTVRGVGQNGRVDVSWEEVESITFER